jgi:surface polysaccharide O-acyltransferase-like enzyme
MEEESSKLNVLHQLNQRIINNNQDKKSKIKKFFICIRNYNNKDTNKKQRNPGIELLRLLGMYAIIVQHVLSRGKALIKYYYKELHLINISSLWNVGCYALISGIIGHKTCKYSNLLYLWVCTVFYSVIIYLYYKKYKKYIWNYNYWKNRTLLENFAPVVYAKYWYFTAYFGMYLFVPLVNKGLSLVNQKELLIIVISLFGIFIIWKDFINFNFDPFRFNNGYSILGLLIFYIAGAYFGKYIIRGNKNRSIFYYLSCLFIYISSTLLCYYCCLFFDCKITILINLSKIFTKRINSFAMILQIISLTLIITQMKYNIIIGKIVSYIGHLTFGVYLIHFNEYIKSFELIKIFQNYNVSTPLRTLIYLVYIRAIQIYIICLIIEYMRYLLFKILKIREICILIEKFINKFFDKLIKT